MSESTAPAFVRLPRELEDRLTRAMYRDDGVYSTEERRLFSMAVLGYWIAGRPHRAMFTTSWKGREIGRFEAIALAPTLL